MFHKSIVIESHFCLRECAKLVKIAKETGCEIKIISKDKEGTTKSMMSLLQLELHPNKTASLFITGKNEREALQKVNKMLKRGV